MKFYWVIKTTVNEYSTVNRQIFETYEEAVKEVMNYTDWYCDKGTCSIEKIDNYFREYETYRFYKGELIRVFTWKE